MYSPTLRLLTVLELLQSHQRISGSDIAARLEIDGRTVRRYIMMLQDMGIPVEAERGPYGAYHLRRGYKLPPMMFTDSEAIALTLGLMVIRKFGFPVEVVAVEGALAKTERVMPEKLLVQAKALQEAITFNLSTSPPPSTMPAPGHLAILSSAVQQTRQVFLGYQAYDGRLSERVFDPYGIVFNEGYWYTAGYCHLRHDHRTFRLDRIVALDLQDGTFERPTDFDILGYVLNSIAMIGDVAQVEVLLKTTLAEAEQVIPPILGTLEETEQGVLFRRSATQLDWIAHLLLSLDFPVVILKPTALREKIASLASRAHDLLAAGVEEGA